MQTKKWNSLFLDRDGVVNERRIDDYVKKIEEFQFTENALEAFRIFARHFQHIFIVTNQQGIGKGLFTMEDLEKVHLQMIREIEAAGGFVSKVYCCPDLKTTGSFFRKPQVGMGLKAKKEFPSVNFKQSVMVGDMRSDMEFGARLRMHTVLIGNNPQALSSPYIVDEKFENLYNFAKSL